MEFTCYDKAEIKIDKTKTWVNIKYKQVFSKEIHYNCYYQIIKRFDLSNRNIEYFVAFLPTSDSDTKPCHIDDYGRTKFSIASIWNDIGYNKLTNDKQIKLEYIETINDADIFKLDL